MENDYNDQLPEQREGKAKLNISGDSKSDVWSSESEDDNSGVDDTEAGYSKYTVISRSNAYVYNDNRPARDAITYSAPKYEKGDEESIVEITELLQLQSHTNKTEQNALDTVLVSKGPSVNKKALRLDETTYRLETFHKHALVIFNHKHFNDPDIDDRLGTEVDVDVLKRTFENFGFEVTSHDDLEKNALFTEAKKFSERDFTDYGCVAVAILTHGSKDGMLRAKDQLYSEVDIINFFKPTKTKATLVSKPKIFIFQACRGPVTTAGVPVFEADSVLKDHVEENLQPYYILPLESDLLILHSSYPGCASHRYSEKIEKRGSWFIQKLCKIITKLSSTEHLESIIIEVKRVVATNMGYIEYNTRTRMHQVSKQMPVMTSTLIRKLYLKKFGEQASEETYMDKSRRRSESRHKVGLADSSSPMTPPLPQSEPCSCFLEHFTYMSNCLRFNSNMNSSSPSKTITGDQTRKRSYIRTRKSSNFNSYSKPLVSSKSLKAPDNNLLLNDSSLNIYENPTPGSSKRCSHASLNIYENPTPGPSKQCDQNIDNYDDNLSDISNFFGSDDSVADPDFSMTDIYKHNFPSYISESSIFSNEDINLNQGILVANSAPIKSVYIATYPDSLIFVDHQQAACYIQPTNNNEDTANNTAYFIAKYPGPIFINNFEMNVNVYKDGEENAEQTSSSHILTSIEIDKINKNKTTHPFIVNDNLSDISNLFGSDDSVADPDFSMTDIYKRNFPSYISESSIGSNEDINLNQDILVANSALALPPISPIKSVYIATYPDSLIFVDHQQATCYIEPTNNNEHPAKNTAYFIAKYPGPIFINKHSNINDSRTNSEMNVNVYNDGEENAEQTSSSHILTSIEIDKINKNKTTHPFIVNDCRGKCKRKCNLFTVDKRKNIWNMYWSMKYEMRRNFLNKSTKIDKIKRRTVTEVNSNSKYHKKESRFYYLPKNNKEINVCQSFFLNNLGHKNDAVITELSKGIKRTALYGDFKENRGGKKSKIGRNPIELHINSYNPAVSHYRRSNAPLVRYLPRTLTVNKMFSDFKSKYPNHTCSKEVYRQTINSMNISFKFPKEDKCVECGIYEEKIKIYNDDVPENVITTFMNHKTKANKAIQKYQEDASQENTANVRYYSMDLQKVMLLPDMPQVKDSFFLSRLIAFNLTFAPITKKSKFNSICVLWHEAYAGRDANNIVDAIAAFVEKERDVQHLTLWCDNCTSQNKNWIIFTALITIVNCGFSNLESLTIKYLTKGHTLMSADGVHGNIEMQIKKQDAVYDFEDYKNVITGCRSNVEVLEVKKSYQWVKKKRAPRRNYECDPLHNFLLNSLVEVKFINGCRNMFYKNDIDQPYMELDFLMKKFNPRSLPSMNNSARGIKESKKEGIISKLLPHMPMNRRQFWQLLPTDNSSLDLVTCGQLVADD